MASIVEPLPVEQGVGRIVFDKFPDHVECDLRIDVAQPFREYFGFRPANRAVQGYQLPVEV